MQDVIRRHHQLSPWTIPFPRVPGVALGKLSQSSGRHVPVDVGLLTAALSDRLDDAFHDVHIPYLRIASLDIDEERVLELARKVLTRCTAVSVGSQTDGDAAVRMVHALIAAATALEAEGHTAPAVTLEHIRLSDRGDLTYLPDLLVLIQRRNFHSVGLSLGGMSLDRYRELADHLRGAFEDKPHVTALDIESPDYAFIVLADCLEKAQGHFSSIRVTAQAIIPKAYTDLGETRQPLSVRLLARIREQANLNHITLSFSQPPSTHRELLFEIAQEFSELPGLRTLRVELLAVEYSVLLGDIHNLYERMLARNPRLGLYLDFSGSLSWEMSRRFGYENSDLESLVIRGISVDTIVASRVMEGYPRMARYLRELHIRAEFSVVCSGLRVIASQEFSSVLEILDVEEPVRTPVLKGRIPNRNREIVGLLTSVVCGLPLTLKDLSATWAPGTSGNNVTDLCKGLFDAASSDSSVLEWLDIRGVRIPQEVTDAMTLRGRSSRSACLLLLIAWCVIEEAQLSLGFCQRDVLSVVVSMFRY